MTHKKLLLILYLQMKLGRGPVGGENRTMNVPCIAFSWKAACTGCLTKFMSLYSLESFLLLDYKEEYNTINNVLYTSFYTAVIIRV